MSPLLVVLGFAYSFLILSFPLTVLEVCQHSESVNLTYHFSFHISDTVMPLLQLNARSRKSVLCLCIARKRIQIQDMPRDKGLHDQSRVQPVGALERGSPRLLHPGKDS